MKAPDESGINKDFTEKSTDWIATAGKRCTDETARICLCWRRGNQMVHITRKYCRLAFLSNFSEQREPLVYSSLERLLVTTLVPFSCMFHSSVLFIDFSIHFSRWGRVRTSSQCFTIWGTSSLSIKSGAYYFCPKGRVVVSYNKRPQSHA